MKILLIALALSSPFARAASEAAKVTCTGVNPHVNQVSFTLSVNDKGAPTATMIYTDLTDDGTTKPPYNDAFDPRDISEATIDYQRLNFVFAHHNTVVKVSADGDIFGGASANDNELDPYNGVLFYQSGNGNAAIERFQIVCRKVK
ncbi:MAG: hypothetical protein ACXWR1_16555 [Bdellovibrionota bacterium]